MKRELWRGQHFTTEAVSMNAERRKASHTRKKERLKAMLYLADQDIKAAALLASNDNHYAAYHCQQAAEKLIKAHLIRYDIEPGIDHHLDVLVNKLPDSDPWKATLAPLHKFTPYATTFRYAGPAGRVPIAPEATQVSADAAHIETLIAGTRKELVGET